MIWIYVAAALIFGTNVASKKCFQRGEMYGRANPLDPHCSTSVMYLDYVSGECQCTRSTYGNADCDRCVIGAGKSCSNTSPPCDDGAACTDSICTCIVGTQSVTTYRRYDCLKLAGMTCTRNENCAESQGLSCVNQVCTCTPGIPCFKKFNEPCSNNAPCDVNNEQGFICEEGHCVCPKNQFLVGNKCQIQPGADCKSDPTRCAYNSFCDSVSKTCQCVEFAAPSAVSQLCECQNDAFRFGSQCDCPFNAEFKTIVCKCPGGSKLDRSKNFCVLKKPFGK